MTGAKRRFGIDRRARREQVAEDFAAVFAGDLANRPSMPLDLPIGSIEPNPYQARMHFDDLDELIAAIRVHGFTSRIRVRPHANAPDRYQLVFGERRLRAARVAGLTIIPAEVAAHSDEEMREIGLTENLLRRDLSPLEEGRAFVAALDAGYSLRRLAERIGKADKGYVENRVAVARAPEDVQAMVAERPDTLRAAREIMKLESERERRPLIAGLVAGDLRRDDVAAIVREQRARTVASLQPPRETPQAAPTISSGTSAAGIRGRASAGAAAGERHAQRAASQRRRQLESEIAQVLAIVGRWRETGQRHGTEREMLGRGIAQILVELDALVQEYEADSMA